jgi:hypothetical protein
MSKRWLIPLMIMSIALGGCGDNKGSATSSTPSSSGIDLTSNLPASIAEIKEVGTILGEKGFTNTKADWDLGGGDLGIPIYDEVHEKMYIAFGDSYSNASQSGNWRSNVLGVSTDFVASDGLTFDSFVNNNRPVARQIIPSLKTDNTEMTTIPTGGLFVNGQMYLFYMSVRHWGAPGEWSINYCGVYKASDPEKGTWAPVSDLVWAGDDGAATQATTGLSKAQLDKRLAPNFLQIFPVDGQDGYIYFYGIPGGRSGGAKLARVLKASFEVFSEYEYFLGRDETGSPKWLKGSAGLEQIEYLDESYLLTPQVGEPSVMYNAYLKKWIFAGQISNGDDYLRFADHPWGPWGTPQKILAQTDLKGLYCAFMNARYSEQDGKIIYLFISDWWNYTVRLFQVTFA